MFVPTRRGPRPSKVSLAVSSASESAVGAAYPEAEAIIARIATMDFMPSNENCAVPIGARTNDVLDLIAHTLKVLASIFQYAHNEAVALQL